MRRTAIASLRRNPLAYRANAAVKSWLLESRRRRLLRRYASAVPVSDADAFAAMRARLAERGVRLRAQSRGALNLFWVGANESQDNGGLLRGLSLFGRVEVFRSAAGRYGPRYPVGSPVDPAVVAQNDAALEAQVAAAQQRGPLDALLGQMWRYVYSPEALGRIAALGIPMINISMDDRLPELWLERRGLRLGAVGLGRVTDLVLTTSPETRAWYRTEGVPAAYFPLASDPTLFSPSGEYRYDVLFVGSRYGYRERLVRTLRRREIPVTVYGPGWPDGSLDGPQVARAFSSARIVLGVGTVAHTSHTYTLKLRDFDAPMSGALYVTHRNPDLLALYREDQEIVCYESADECARKLKHYLSNEADRLRIATAGRERARADYTWEARFADLFHRIGLLAAD